MISALLGGFVPGVSVSGALAASLSPSTIIASGSTPSISTASVTATATGGMPPYTYSWNALYGNPDNVQAVSPTSATTAFRRSSAVSGGEYFGSFTCTVKDALGATATTDVVTVDISRV